MNILTDRLPDGIVVAGREYPIRTDFQTWIRFELLALDDQMDMAGKVASMLELVFGAGKIPPTLQETMAAIQNFYAGAPESTEQAGAEKAAPHEAIYSFAHDADYIYSAFWAQYGIDLQAAKLHWWQFKALFKSLSGENMIVKIMEYRSVNLAEIKDKGQKDFYRKMKRRYALPKPENEREKISQIEEALLNGGDLSGVL